MSSRLRLQCEFCQAIHHDRFQTCRRCKRTLPREHEETLDMPLRDAVLAKLKTAPNLSIDELIEALASDYDRLLDVTKALISEGLIRNNGPGDRLRFKITKKGAEV